MNDLISRQQAIEKFEPWLKVDGYSEGELNMLKAVLHELRFLPSAQPEQCEDAVPRASVEYICRKNTVSTNPYGHEYHDKFIQFMDDPEISDFGRWQHSNGFNTALVAVKCDLDKVPSAEPEPKWIPVSERMPEEGERVLATHLGGLNPNNQVIEHIYQCGKFTYGWDMDMDVHSPTFGQRYMGEVIAWMPLPEPWKGETNV